ncbi:pali-domain-containing protein [Punctularia strigosozonata HHB-11173 SS5]|uniref:pali-domain-containing protein n=1 Tax=Punctularia strigosozonata (strain HHB-11173) TaxID=741275 RepID=UPI0004416320|nr:pali-domain-containing protein [Punctularia strigosozonata HHB-11173 SS5]EIN13846.1 pali-domain-containing protein [Punctularia strigosozonata HHB-11173 SS5]
MGLIRPATPGFLVTLVATILLAIVSFSVPYFKSVFFLKASLSVESINGSVTFGTLGYCLEISGQSTNCTSPHIGYELDINSLVGNDLPIKIPNVVVKWLTYALFLHVVALILSAISAVFGLLAHVREMSMACCSTCISGFAAAIALLAFIFDLAFFFIAKSRINSVSGGSAQMGNAIWLTLAAWVLLFFSGCFYGIGRCCIRNRPRAPRGDSKWNAPSSAEQGNNRYADQMRLDAVKAEADRKAAQKRGEVGLPAFDEYDAAQPLNPSKVTYAVIDGDRVVAEDEHHAQSYRDQPSSTQHPGYAQAAPGTRAVDEYHSASPQRQPSSHSTYPPQAQTPSQMQSSARRQGSGHSGYASSAYNTGYPTSSPAAVPPMPSVSPVGAAAAVAGTAAAGQYLAPSGYGHQQYATGGTFGHGQDMTSYHSAHSQYPSQQYYDAQTDQGHWQDPSFNAEAYGAMVMPGASHSQSYSPAQPTQHGAYGQYHSPSPPMPSAHDRSYTLGGGGYGASSVPVHAAYEATAYAQPQPEVPMPSPAYDAAYTNDAARTMSPTSPVRGPRSPPPRNTVASPTQYDDEPPQYQEASGSSGNGGPLHPPGGWNSNEKR